MITDIVVDISEDEDTYDFSLEDEDVLMTSSSQHILSTINPNITFNMSSTNTCLSHKGNYIECHKVILHRQWLQICHCGIKARHIRCSLHIHQRMSMENTCIF